MLNGPKPCPSLMRMAHVTAGARTSCDFSWTWISRQWTSRTSGTTSCVVMTRCRHFLSDDSTRPRGTLFSNSTQTTFRPTTPASEVSSNSSTEVRTMHRTDLHCANHWNRTKCSPHSLLCCDPAAWYNLSANEDFSQVILTWMYRGRWRDKIRVYIDAHRQMQLRSTVAPLKLRK